MAKFNPKKHEKLAGKVQERLKAHADATAKAIEAAQALRSAPEKKRDGALVKYSAAITKQHVALDKLHDAVVAEAKSGWLDTAKPE